METGEMSGFVPSGIATAAALLGVKVLPMKRMKPVLHGGRTGFM